MKRKFLIIDLANMFYRCYSTAQGDSFTKAGLALHVSMCSILKVWKAQEPDHLVFAMEGKSWRKSVYPMYKKNRDVKKALRTAREVEDDTIAFEALNSFIEFLKTKSNVTCLHADQAEGDDFIARWIQRHPDDNHVILSSDTDFTQLISDNVNIFDAIKDIQILPEGVLDTKGNLLEFTITSSSKLKVGKKVNMLTESFEPPEDWMQYSLFLKCIRGDASDGVFSAYPKVRINRLEAAWKDRKEQGFDWTNLMHQTWKDGEVTKTVKDEYEINRSLIDLTQQPQYVLDIMDEVIDEQIAKAKKDNIGFSFMRFCGMHELTMITRNATEHAKYLNAPYTKA